MEAVVTGCIQAYHKLLSEGTGEPGASANTTWAVRPVLLSLKLIDLRACVGQLATSCACDPDRRRRVSGSFVPNTKNGCRLSLNLNNSHVLVKSLLMLTRDAVGHRPVDIHRDYAAVEAKGIGCQRAQRHTPTACRPSRIAQLPPHAAQVLQKATTLRTDSCALEQPR